MQYLCLCHLGNLNLITKSSSSFQKNKELNTVVTGFGNNK